jgi:hypothetical protein
MAALAATGALIVGGSAVAMVGSGNADPLLPVPAPVVGTTYVLPDLAPFTDNGTREGGVREVTDAFGAPTGGGDAALRLTTPGSNDKASIVSREDAGSPLAEWIPTAAYSAYQGAVNPAAPFQFPSLQLIVDFNGSAEGGFATLFYEPVYNEGASTTPDTWHRYQAGAGRWCSTKVIPDVIDSSKTFCSNGGALPLADYIAGQSDIIVNGVVVNQGSGNAELDAAVDLVTTPSTTYDFELTKPVVIPGPDSCDETTLPTVPSHPGGENGGHEDGGHEDGGHEDGGHEQPSNGGHEDGGNAGHEDGGQEQPDDGGHEDGGHEQPDDGGHEQPEPQPDPCK